MKIVLRYRIVFEGEYEVDPTDLLYDTENVEEIIEQEREWAQADLNEFINCNELPATEILILPK